VHVCYIGPDVEQLAIRYCHRFRLLGDYSLLRLDHFMVLVVCELVVLKLLIKFVEAIVVEFAVDKPEEDTHVWMVVQGHSGALFDKEQN